MNKGFAFLCMLVINLMVTSCSWRNKRDGVYGFFIAHVRGRANKEDGFSSFYGSPVLSKTVTEIVNKSRKQ